MPEAACAQQSEELCSELSLDPVLTLCRYRGQGRNIDICTGDMRIIHRLFKAIFCTAHSAVAVQSSSQQLSWCFTRGCSSERWGSCSGQSTKRLRVGGSTNTESSRGSLSSSSQSSAEHQAVLNEPLCSQHQLLGNVNRAAASWGLQEMRACTQPAKEQCCN